VWNDLPVDAIARYCAATEQNDMDGMIETLSGDAAAPAAVARAHVVRPDRGPKARSTAGRDPASA
jgi:hypothetical protein